MLLPGTTVLVHYVEAADGTGGLALTAATGPRSCALTGLVARGTSTWRTGWEQWCSGWRLGSRRCHLRPPRLTSHLYNAVSPPLSIAALRSAAAC